MHRQLVRQQEKNSQQMHKAYPPHLCRLYLAGINGDFYDLTAVFREWSREWFRAFQRIVLAFPWKLGYDRQRFSMRYTWKNELRTYAAGGKSDEFRRVKSS